MPTEVPKIVTRLQLENSLRTQDHTITIAELVKIFGDEHKDLDYPDKAENSQLSEAFDYIINNQKIAENLCEILDMSNDFEECLGIREISGMMRIYFWQKISKIGGAGGKILAQRWSQNIKTRKFNNLPYNRIYDIMLYCVRINKNFLEEEDIWEHKPTTGFNQKWINLLELYNFREAAKISEPHIQELRLGID